MNIALIFSAKISLSDWVRNGLADRELELYISMLEREEVSTVFLFTYGCDDSSILDSLLQDRKCKNNLVVVDMPKIFDSYIGKTLYQFIMPFSKIDMFNRVDIVKTNQIEAAIPAIILKLIFKKVVYMRCGYVLSDFLAKQKRFIRYSLWYPMEKLLFKISNYVCVSSQSDKMYLQSRHGKRNVYINPNYINVNKFLPIDSDEASQRLLYIGRFSDQKNLEAMLTAVKRLDLTIDLYGWGDLEAKIKSFCKENQIKANFMGKISNNEIPRVMACYDFYLLCSYYEGTPKTLLEAMSCGKVCIVTSVPGIREIVIDKYNGIVSKNTTNESIASAIKIAFNLNEQEKTHIKLNARNTIVNNHSFKSYLTNELKIYSNNYD
ncbi:glycosyltransferase family 4 protein [Vibrio anguillarum]|uniref:glycosyltransferase family 4 protein n=1 Tax=Vibrio anguillarum TaxID=55601 RepID=UPI0003178069|nr:glycosyltransferase family 4 protein [Vibrio anguillarum]OEE38962.1 hypothetical protein A1QU_09265 [Vibrio anguillarum]